MALTDGSEKRAVNLPVPDLWAPPDRTPPPRLFLVSAVRLWSAVKLQIRVFASQLAASFLGSQRLQGLFSTGIHGISPSDEQLDKSPSRQRRSLFHCWFKVLVVLSLLVFCWCVTQSYSSLSFWKKFPQHKYWFFNQSYEDKEPVYQVHLQHITTPSKMETTPECGDICYHQAFPRNYQFIMDNTDVCKNTTPFLVLMVPVAPNDVAARDAIRQTWGKDSTVQGEVVLTLFMLGLSNGADAEQLKQENEQHHDLIQSNFMDTYLNLTIKTMVIMDWLSTHCQRASYAMKVDSDMFLNIENLVIMLQKPGVPKLNYLTGKLMPNIEVIRSEDSKWYVSEELYPDSHYPTYTMGMGYIFSNDLPGKYVEVSKSIKPFNIEDAYIGMCMKKLGLTPTSPPDPSQFKAYSSGYSRCEYSKIITYILGSSEELKNYWADYKQPGPHC